MSNLPNFDKPWLFSTTSGTRRRIVSRNKDAAFLVSCSRQFGGVVHKSGNSRFLSPFNQKNKSLQARTSAMAECALSNSFPKACEYASCSFGHLNLPHLLGIWHSGVMACIVQKPFGSFVDLPILKSSPDITKSSYSMLWATLVSAIVIHAPKISMAKANGTPQSSAISWVMPWMSEASLGMENPSGL